MDIILEAYDFYGGGACPTQFFWHNEDKSKWYYFRFRHNYFYLKESFDDLDEGPMEAWDKATIIIDDIYRRF